MPPAQETFFSLELVIDYVRFDRSRGIVLDPAVGVRLLDLPTVLIYKYGREDPSKSGCADLDDRQPDDLKYPFQRGKSCVFKINLDSLHTLLLHTPLYAMVLDVKDEIPRLIGSSLICLAKVTERIKLDVDKHGINATTAHGERLVSPICNLMGKSIGVISLSYKIGSLGANVIPHIPDNRVYWVSVTPAKDDVPAEAPEIHNVLSQQSKSLDGHPDILISEVKQSGVSAYPQNEQAGQSVSWSEDDQKYTTFCPTNPFYRSNGKNQQEKKSFTGLQPLMECLSIEDLEDGNDEKGSSEVFEIPEVDRMSKLTSTPKSRCTETDSAPLVDVIRQLPLLNALLAELSQLNVQRPHKQPLSIHPNLAWLYTPEPAGKPKSKSQKTSPKQSSKRIKCAKNGKTDEQKFQPQKKLKYGLTNTFRLRLKLAKSDLGKQYTFVEYLDQQKKPRFSDARKADSKGVKLSVETVIEKNPSKSQTRPSAKKIHNSANCWLIERDKTVVTSCDPHSVSANVSNPGFQSNKEDGRSRNRAHLSNNDDEYQDDFASRNTTDGDSPDPFSSPEPGSSISGSKALPVPSKADNSSQLSIKSTHIIRPRLTTLALSVSSDDSDDELGPQSQSCGQNASTFWKIQEL